MQAISNDIDVELKSSYLEYLPGLYRKHEFMGRFLLIFESILAPIENTIDNINLYFDPMMTLEPLLPWLGSWMDLALDPTWPEERRRELVKSAAELYRWQGTKRGLTEYLRIYTGIIPEISEHIEGMRLDPETKLGVNSKLGASGGGNHFTITLDLAGRGNEIDENKIRAIIDVQKPAHTVYTLHMTQSNPEVEDNHGA